MKNRFTVEPLKDDKYQIKTECIDIKSEEDNESHVPLMSIHEGHFKTIQRRNLEGHRKCRNRRKLKHKNGSQVRMYNCDQCSYETKFWRDLDKHQLKHKDAMPMYQCDQCSYESRYRSNLTKHQSKHENPPQQIYRCGECDYETRYRGCLDRHQLEHTEPSQVRKSKFNKCSFSSKYRKCSKCEYETIYGSSFKNHQFIHKDLSQTMYKCDKCIYVTSCRSSFENHQSRHNEPSWEETCRTYSRRNVKISDLTGSNGTDLTSGPSSQI